MEQYCTECLYCVVCVLSSANGHLGCLHPLTIMTSALVNVHVQVSLNAVLWGTHSRVESWGHQAVVRSLTEGSSKLCSTADAGAHVPTSSGRGRLICHMLTNTRYLPSSKSVAAILGVGGVPHGLGSRVPGGSDAEQMFM